MKSADEALHPPSVVLVTPLRPSAPFRHSRARHGNPRPLATGPPTTPLCRPSAPLPSFSCPDTGTHAPGDRTADYAPTSPPSVILVPRHGNPRLPRPDRRHYMCEPRPRHQPLPPTPPTPLTCSLRPVEACPEPVEGRPETTWRRRAAAPSRFTSKCRKMSQNVALFRPSTRKLASLRVENLTIWADSRPFWPISVHFLIRRHVRGA